MKIIFWLIAVLFLISVISFSPATAESSLDVQSTTNAAESITSGWIDLNKNGRMDVYENPKAPIERRVDDLLRQMNLDEKTCQTATLYGVGRGRTGLAAAERRIADAGMEAAALERRDRQHR